MSCTPPPSKVGQAVEGLITIVTIDTGQLYNPPSLFAWAYHIPSKTTISVAPARISQGIYKGVFVPTLAGPWVLRFANSATPPVGSTIVIEQHFVIAPLDF